MNLDFFKKKETPVLIEINRTYFDELKAKRNHYKTILESLLSKLQEVKNRLNETEELTLDYSRLLKAKKDINHKIDYTTENLKRIKPKYLIEQNKIIHKYLLQKHQIKLSDIIKELDL